MAVNLRNETASSSRMSSAPSTAQPMRNRNQSELHVLRGVNSSASSQDNGEPDVTSQQEDISASKSSKSTPPRANRNPSDPMSTEAAVVLREMGYQQDKIRDAIITVRRQKGEPDVTTQQVLAWLLDQHEARSPPTSTRSSPTRDLVSVVRCNPKHPDYRELNARINSYQGWPDYLDQTTRQMAEAGFFFVGKADYTRCFCCGGGLRNWEPGDDPMLEHARWFPRCEYINKLKGERYVAAEQRRHQQHIKEQQRQQQELARSRDANCNPPNPMSTEAAAVLREMGYQQAQIIDIILTVRRQIGEPDVTTQQVLAWLLDQHEARSPPTSTRSSPTRGIKRRTKGNEKSREMQDCRICMQRPITTTFLPCGHSECCEQCAVKRKRCPVCRKRINRFV